MTQLDISRLVAGQTLHLPLRTLKTPLMISAWLWVSLIVGGWALVVWFV